MVFDCFLFLYLLAILPRLLFDRIRGKKHPRLAERLGFQIFKPNKPLVLWIHAVSVGEVKAAQPLFLALKEEYPDAFFLITTTTATGQAEAQRSLKAADAFCYLPLDFSWIVRRWAKRLRPKLLFLIEGDIWPNLLSAAHKVGAKTILVSGKMSRHSARRLGYFPQIARHLFSSLDLLLVQNAVHHSRFSPFVDPKRLRITGNLKFDLSPQPTDTTFWKQHISLPTITLASTHAPEEAWLLEALKDLPLFIFLAPRHPERIPTIAGWLRQQNISFLYSSNPHFQGQRVVLVDTMGQLPLCYTLSALAIVGGSFVSHVGGHNILEPCLYGTPVLFGPHVAAQEELAHHLLESRAGRQVPLDELRSAVCDMLATDNAALRQAAHTLVAGIRGSTKKTVQEIRAFLN